MRIHSDTLTRSDLSAAMRAVNDAHHGEHGYLYVNDEPHRSRKRAGAFEIALEGDGTKTKRRAGHSLADGGYAATWDQWGWFLAELFRIDPNMTTQYYVTEDDFHDKTHGQFETTQGA